MWVQPNQQPTMAGFQTFITNVMGISSVVLPPSSPVIQWCFDFAMNWVYPLIQCVPSQLTSWSLYQRAVYNLAGDTLINWAQDQEGQNFFETVRDKFGCNSFVAGVISSSSDEGTSESLVVPEAFKELTIANLSNLKTPYGRAYLGIVQSWGTVWGLS